MILAVSQGNVYSSRTCRCVILSVLPERHVCFRLQLLRRTLHYCITTTADSLLPSCRRLLLRELSEIIVSILSTITDETPRYDCCEPQHRHAFLPSQYPARRMKDPPASACHYCPGSYLCRPHPYLDSCGTWTHRPRGLEGWISDCRIACLES